MQVEPLHCFLDVPLANSRGLRVNLRWSITLADAEGKYIGALETLYPYRGHSEFLPRVARVVIGTPSSVQRSLTQRNFESTLLCWMSAPGVEAAGYMSRSAKWQLIKSSFSYHEVGQSASVTGSIWGHYRKGRREVDMSLTMGMV